MNRLRGILLVSEPVVSWAREYSAVHDAMVYRRFDGPIPERARFAAVHDRDVPQRVKDFLSENGAPVCGDVFDRCVPINPDPASTNRPKPAA